MQKETGVAIRGVTLRAFLIGIVLILLNAYWLVQAEFVLWEFNPTYFALAPNVVFSLFWVTGLNLLVGKFSPRLSLLQGELLVIYMMVALSSSLGGIDYVQTLIFQISAASWVATPENEWAQLFHRYLPDWLTLSDKSILEGLYRGTETLYLSRNLNAWLFRLGAWAAFFGAILLSLICISVLIRHPWSERERLSYPIAQIPYELTRNGNGRFFANRQMWLGFGIAGGLTLLNGLSYFYPALPRIPIWYHSLKHLFTEKPWNAIAWIGVSFQPFAIGLGFLMPLSLLFSCWFFVLFWQGQNILSSLLGQQQGGFFGRGEQVSGAWIGFLTFTLWMSRRYFIEVVRNILGSGRRKTSSNELLSYQTLILLMLGAFVLIFLFCHWAGISAWIIVLFFCIYFALATTVTRIRAQLGPPVHNMYGAGPDYILVYLFGTRRLSGENLTKIALFRWFAGEESSRSHPMPHILEGFKLANRGGISDKAALVVVLFFAGMLGMLTTFWITLHLSYQLGAEVRVVGPPPRFAVETYQRLANWLTYPNTMNLSQVVVLCASFLFTGSLLMMHRYFLWWPLHPIGYILGSSVPMPTLWFPLFLSFLLKWGILKYGGIRMYRRAVPFFIGLILGQYIVGCGWSLLGILLQERIYVGF